jgi:hypothetical protein
LITILKTHLNDASETITILEVTINVYYYKISWVAN